MNLRKIRKEISDPGIKVISFDVFDTMILRPFWKPSDLFMLMDREADRLLETTDVCSFSSLRIEAEAEVRRIARAEQREDIKLQEIYDFLDRKELLPSEMIHQLMIKEIELEKRYCTARKSVKGLAEYALEQGKTVIAISDMYLPSSVIADILENCGYPVLHKIFVSGEVCMTKSSGGLFRYAAKKMDVHPDEILHIGDNMVSDVMTPSRIGIRAFHFPRTIDLLEGKNSLLHGRSFKEAFQHFNSSFSGANALSQLGIRCMLATAANLVYDDPFRNGRQDGSYADDPEMFGTFALGMYCMAHAMWIGSLTKEETYDHAIFFARDGYLIRKGYKYIRRYDHSLPKSSYMYISRRAMLPVQMADRQAVFSSGFSISFRSHTPKTLVKVLTPVLKADLGQIETEMGSKWDKTFDSEMSLYLFLQDLFDHYMDEEKCRETVVGFQKYFAPYSESRVLTYDVGYHMRQDILLKRFFPEMKITACFTHLSDDLAEKRGKKAGIRLRTLYPFSPYVTGYPRELFQSENGPSCEGYSSDGNPVLQEDYVENNLLAQIQHYAIRYMREFTNIFREETFLLPMDYVLACLPFETFLHRPGSAAQRWVRGLEYLDSFTWGVSQVDGYEAWRRMRLHFWCARNHVGKYGKYAVFFVVLCFTDRSSLMRILNERFLPKFKGLSLRSVKSSDSVLSSMDHSSK